MKARLIAVVAGTGGLAAGGVGAGAVRMVTDDHGAPVEARTSTGAGGAGAGCAAETCPSGAKTTLIVSWAATGVPPSIAGLNFVFRTASTAALSNRPSDEPST